MEVNLVRAAPLWRCKPVFSPAIPVFLTKDIRMQISIITHVRDTRTPAAGVYKLLVKELVSICAFYLMGTAAAMGSGSGGGGGRGEKHPRRPKLLDKTVSLPAPTTT